MATLKGAPEAGEVGCSPGLQRRQCLLLSCHTAPSMSASVLLHPMPLIFSGTLNVGFLKCLARLCLCAWLLGNWILSLHNHVVSLSLDFGNKSINFKLFLFCFVLFLPCLRFIRLSSLLDNAGSLIQSQMPPEVLCVAQIFNLGFESCCCLDPVWEGK